MYSFNYVLAKHRVKLFEDSALETMQPNMVLTTTFHSKRVKDSC